MLHQELSNFAESITVLWNTVWEYLKKWKIYVPYIQ